MDDSMLPSASRWALAPDVPADCPGATLCPPIARPGSVHQERIPMPYLFNLIYLVVMSLASPWLLYSAMRKQKYREGFAAKFLGRSYLTNRWQPPLHLVACCQRRGSQSACSPCWPALEQEYPDHDLVISTTTRTGFELARQKYSPRPVFYSPLDFTWAVRTPRCAAFVPTS